MIFLAVIWAFFGVAHCQSNVIFAAGLTKNVTYDQSAIVVFDHVFSNVGNGYDPATGVFTCPNGDAGTYAFQLHTMSFLNGSSWLEMYKNTDYIVTVYAHANDDYATAGNAVVLQMQAGDTLEVKAVDPTIGETTTLWGHPTEMYSSFSGYKLSTVH